MKPEVEQDFRLRENQRIAIVGGGVAGIVSAHLLSRKHRVEILEANTYLGGHTNTVTLETDDRVAVDTGFIVLNDKNYPLLHRFLSELRVAVRYSDMSFGYHCESSGFIYSGTSLNGLFADRANLIKPKFWHFLLEIRRFCRISKQWLSQSERESETLKSFLSRHRFDSLVVDHFVIPMAAAIWSAGQEQVELAPTEFILRFFENHGLLSLKERPKWQTVVGGSKSYVEAFLANFKGEVRLSTPVRSISRAPSSIRVETDTGLESYDCVVCATHANVAYQLIKDPSPLESELLQPWSYEKNPTVLHTDKNLLPDNRRAWASWNYSRKADNRKHVLVSYHMNRLQGLKTDKDYFVSLNTDGRVRDEHILREIDYQHPRFDVKSAATQRRLHELNSSGRLFFAGSYFGNGFHEDAVRSAVQVGRLFGEEL